MEEKNLILEAIEEYIKYDDEDPEITIEDSGKLALYIQDLLELTNEDLWIWNKWRIINFINRDNKKYNLAIKLEWKIPSYISEINFYGINRWFLFNNLSYEWKINIERWTANLIKLNNTSISLLTLSNNTLKDLRIYNTNNWKNKFNEIKISNNKLSEIQINNTETENKIDIIKNSWNLKLLESKLKTIKIENHSWNIEINNTEWRLIILYKSIKSILKVININILNNSNLDKISIYSEKDLEKTKFNIKFENIRFNSNPNSYYYLARLKLENLEFENCSNFSEMFKINNLKTDNLIINDFILWKMVINWLKIKNQLKLKNPVLNETIFNNVEFPKNDIKIAWEENSKNYWEIKEYYIQLKNVMDNSWNHIQADKFFAKEMEYYGKSLKWKKWQFWNKLVYYIQKWISDFWNVWTLPVLWMINLWNLNIILTQKYYFTLFYILIFWFFYYILHKSFWFFKEQSNFKKIVKNILMIFLAFLLFTIFYYFYYKISLDIILKNNIEILNYLDEFANSIKPLDILNVTSDITFFSLIYKIILAILIYHLIISLKRLTKR